MKNAKECFAAGFGKHKINDMFNRHRRCEDPILNQIYVLDNIACVEVFLRSDEGERRKWYILHKEDDGWKIYQPESLSAISSDRLVRIARTANAPKANVEQMLEEMCCA